MLEIDSMHTEKASSNETQDIRSKQLAQRVLP